MDIPDLTGCVYRATNLVTGKIYVGLATGRLHRRIRGHLNAARAGSMLAFHCALRKHGCKCFLWEILESGLTKDELLQKEPWYIQQNDSYRNGYNSTLGGDGCSGLIWTEQQRKQLSHTRRKCPVIDASSGLRYGSIRDASQETGASPDGIIRTCQGRQRVTSGIRFEYEDPVLRQKAKHRKMSLAIMRMISRKYATQRRSRSQEKRKREVWRASDGQRFECIADAARQTGLPAGAISRCCQGYSDIVHGDQFRYTDTAMAESAEHRRQQRKLAKEMTKKPVIRMSDGVIYSSASEAARENMVDCSGIIACCRGRGRNTLGGHAWEYADSALRKESGARKQARKEAGEKNKQNGIRKRKKPIVCVETGITYLSQTDASKATGISIASISHCLTGRNQSAGGFTWEYKK